MSVLGYSQNSAIKDQTGFPFKTFSCEKSAPEIYRCKDCDFRTDLLTFLKQHVQQVHPTENVSFCVSVEYTLQTFICQNCTFETYSSLQWLRHFKIGCYSTETQHEETEGHRDYKAKFKQNLKERALIHCDKCSFKTKFKQSMSKHNIRLHLASEEIQWFQCDKCPYKAKIRDGLRYHKINRHIVIHSADSQRTQCTGSQWCVCKNSFECSHCGFKAHRQQNLKRHLLRCHPPSERNWLKCDHCKYKTKLEENLKSHVRNKHREWKDVDLFHCDKCSYKSKRKGQLRRHNITRHLLASEKVECFQCVKCPFKTKHKKCLMEHNIRLHLAPEEIQWLQCDKCEYKAKLKKDLKYHKIRKHSGPWFQCDKCDFKAEREDMLIFHNINLHSAPSPFKNCTKLS